MLTHDKCCTTGCTTLASNILNPNLKPVLIYRNAEGVHGQRKFDNTCRKPSPSPRQALMGLVLQTKLQASPKLKHENYESVEFLSIFRMSIHPAQTQSPAI